MFKLYKTECKMLDFTDYGVILDYARGCKTALEFGPGISTLALIEAGCHVTSCEYQPEWLAEAEKNLAGHGVALHGYTNDPLISILGVDHCTFDIGFVDSPTAYRGHWLQHPGQEGLARWNTLIYAVRRCKITLLHDAKRRGEQSSLNKLTGMGYRVSMIETKKGIAVIE